MPEPKGDRPDSPDSVRAGRRWDEHRSGNRRFPENSHRRKPGCDKAEGRRRCGRGEPAPHGFGEAGIRGEREAPAPLGARIPHASPPTCRIPGRALGHDARVVLCRRSPRGPRAPVVLHVPFESDCGPRRSADRASEEAASSLLKKSSGAMTTSSTTLRHLKASPNPPIRLRFQAPHRGGCCRPGIRSTSSTGC